MENTFLNHQECVLARKKIHFRVKPSKFWLNKSLTLCESSADTFFWMRPKSCQFSIMGQKRLTKMHFIFWFPFDVFIRLCQLFVGREVGGLHSSFLQRKHFASSFLLKGLLRVMTVKICQLLWSSKKNKRKTMTVSFFWSCDFL